MGTDAIRTSRILITVEMDKLEQISKAIASSGSIGVAMVTCTMVLLATLPVLLSWLSMKKEPDEEDEQEQEQKKEIVHLGDVSLEELKDYTGKDPSKPLIV